jgi:peptide/nickel transport system ATP-binding protein
MAPEASILPASEDRGGPAQPLLIVENLRKYFPVRGGILNRQVATVQAVDDISFAVAKGETLGIVGESGCGKSTTARLLIRLIEPDIGNTIFDGEMIGALDGISVADMRRQVQMVFQDSYASLNPRLTIEDTIAFAPCVHGVSGAEAKRRARDLLGKVGLDPNLFVRRYPHELSGGQRQRVNIARALALEPKLVVLDEPVSALDKSVEAQVLNLLVDLKEELGLTYIFISHDLNVVRYMSDRVLVMYLGKIVEIGPVDSIYDSPRHPYTRALLSAMPSMDPAKRTQEPPLTGDPPNPINPPSGCRFHTRCPFAEAVCSAKEPALAAMSDVEAHQAACHMAVAGSGHSKALAS